MTILVTGIPGSGKSTLLNAIRSLLPNLPILNFGEMMLKQAALQGLERDALRLLPIQQQQEICLATAQNIAKMSSPKILVDTHLCIKTPIGYCPGFPFKVLKELQPKGLLLIDASPATILQRRKEDLQRKRDTEDIATLALHQELTKAFLVSTSVLTGAPLAIIPNDSNTIFENIQLIMSFLNSI